MGKQTNLMLRLYYVKGMHMKKKPKRVIETDIRQKNGRQKERDTDLESYFIARILITDYSNET
jgi:hypothetical protein